MPDFKNLNDLFASIRESVSEVLTTEVAQEVVEIEKYWIAREVYLAYKPEKYKRKEDQGGLIDDANFEKLYLGNGLLSVRSVRADGNRDVSAIVEYGHEKAKRLLGYGYRYADDGTLEYLQARPFTESTREQLRAEGYHVDAMKRGLEKKGIRYK